MAKICTVCGKDVAYERRVKDEAGKYYCQRCSTMPTRKKNKTRGNSGGDAILLDGHRSALEPAPAPIEAGNEAGTKRCPFCAEAIQAMAVKCRFCGSSILTESKAVTGGPSTTAIATDTTGSMKSTVPSSATSRFLRGGVVGVLGGEQHCTPPEQMRLGVKGKPSAGKVARRLILLALLGIAGFVAIIASAVGWSKWHGTNSDSDTGNVVAVPPEQVRQQQAESAQRQQQDDLQREADRRQSIKDKADWVRQHGDGSFSLGSDEDLARMYDRLKAQSDSSAARDRRLGN